jgi:hypothetical protein
LAALTFVCTVYLPDLGRGFVKDDFGWVATGARVMHEPWKAFSLDASGTFYRPLVTLSFAADYALHGLVSRGYGFTNFVLYLGCALAIDLLLLELNVLPLAAAVGTAAWMINPHGIGMAVLWLSGRTTLLMALCSLLCVYFYLKGYRVAAALSFAGALFSKEDALLLPIIVAAVTAAHRGVEWPWSPGTRRRIAVDLSMCAACVGTYLWMRGLSGALTVASAPSYYRLTWDPSILAANALQYLDRGWTGITIIAILAATSYRKRPSFDARARRLTAAAIIWFVAGLAITWRVPVRSSLYAVFPSIGGALALAILVDAMRRQSTANEGDLRLAAVIPVVLLLVVQVYWVRDDQWIEAARVSNRVMHVLSADAGRWPARGAIVLEDEPVRHSNLHDAFGTMAADALHLFTGRTLSADVIRQGVRISGPMAAHYRLHQGRVERID